MTNFTKHQTEQQKIQSNVVNATDNISNKSNNSDNPVTLHLKYGVCVCFRELRGKVRATAMAFQQFIHHAINNDYLFFFRAFIINIVEKNMLCGYQPIHKILQWKK